MLIEGSSASSRRLVGEHQPDEPMRDGGRPAAGGDERDEGLAGGRAHAWVRMARGRRREGVAFQDEQGAVVGRQDQRSCLRRARWLSPPPLSQDCPNARNKLCAKKALERATVRALESSATAEVHRGWNKPQMEQVSRGNCQLNQDPAPPAHLLPELRPELLPAEEKKACDRGGGESHRARRRQLRWSWRPATAPFSS